MGGIKWGEVIVGIIRVLVGFLKKDKRKDCDKHKEGK